MATAPAFPVPLSSAERQARHRERTRAWKAALVIIRRESNEPDIRTLADTALRGIAE